MTPSDYRDAWSGPASQREGFTMTPEPISDADLEALADAYASAVGLSVNGMAARVKVRDRLYESFPSIFARTAALRDRLARAEAVCEAMDYSVKLSNSDEPPGMYLQTQADKRVYAALTAWRAGPTPTAACSACGHPIALHQRESQGCDADGCACRLTYGRAPTVASPASDWRPITPPGVRAASREVFARFAAGGYCPTCESHKTLLDIDFEGRCGRCKTQMIASPASERTPAERT